MIFLSRHMAFYEDGWRQRRKKRGKKEINKKIGQNNLQLEGLCLSPRVYRLRS